MDIIITPPCAVNVTKVVLMELAVSLSRNNCIGHVVKNTGHDTSGRSGGEIWHRLGFIGAMCTSLVHQPKYKRIYRGVTLKGQTIPRLRRHL